MRRGSPGKRNCMSKGRKIDWRICMKCRDNDIRSVDVSLLFFVVVVVVVVIRLSHRAQCVFSPVSSLSVYLSYAFVFNPNIARQHASHKESHTYTRTYNAVVT